MSEYDSLEDLLSMPPFNSYRQIRNSDEIIGELSSSRQAYIVDKPVYAVFPDSRQMFFLGNEHDRIYGFTVFSRKLGLLSAPFSIVNFDEHIDDSGYNPDHLHGMNASWQRFFAENGWTASNISYNIYPAEGAEQLSSYVTEAGVLHFAKSILPDLPAFDLCSVDLDFFNGLRKGDRVWNAALSTIKSIAKTAQVTMLFTSPVFTQHKEGINIAREIFDAMDG